MDQYTAGRILKEVMSGKVLDSKDTPEEALYRKEVAAQVARIQAEGGTVETPEEF